MSYTTGTANSVTDLLTALIAACVGAGWTQSGKVLSKGGCYVLPDVIGSALTVTAGRGIDGSNNLTSPATAWPSMLGAVIKGLGIAWPATYHIHIGAANDEVYLIINHSITYYQWIAWGRSPVASLAAPATGTWFAGTANYGGGKTNIRCSVNSFGSYGSGTSAAPFWSFPSDAATQSNATSAFDHGMENQWCYAVARQPAEQVLMASPSAWNGESVLAPIQVLTARPSSLWSLVGELTHARYVRLDNLAPGQIVTLGPDRWKVYPFYRLDASSRDGGDNIDHTGTLGWAIRYDGS